MFKRSKTGAVIRAALPFANFASDKISHYGAKGFRMVADQLDGRVENKFSNMESALQKFDFDQLVDKVRSIDPLDTRHLANANKALEAEVEELRTQLAEAIKPKKKGLGVWWWLIILMTCGLGLFVAAAWWLYGSDDDDLFDEFDDFTLLDTEHDIPNVHEAAEEAKENAKRLVEDAVGDDTVDLG
ncbi:hypothetical protein [Stomatohabitans albus]|uniref:hypothetical protein n=1 Tax=Stomatohabitans albus TaxID=3110766 RepID=UPI00300C0CEC